MTIKFTPEEKRHIIPLVRRYFLEERGDDMGDLAADIFLDFVAESIAPTIYNRALADARRTIQESIADLEYRLYELEKPLPREK